jgi:large subunit ribosomal protein L17
MRHLSAVKSLSRKPAHRLATMRNMVINLVEHERIRTTVQKAKAARPFAEQLITLGKKGTPHHRRLAISELGSTVQAKRTVKKIFDDLKARFKDREGGYTRILRLPATIRQVQADLPRGKKINRSKFYGTRLGDNSTLVLWELCEAEVAKREKSKKDRKGKKPKKKDEPKAAPKLDAGLIEAAKTAPAIAETPPTPAVEATTGAEHPPKGKDLPTA